MKSQFAFAVHQVSEWGGEGNIRKCYARVSYFSSSSSWPPLFVPLGRTGQPATFTLCLVCRPQAEHFVVCLCYTQNGVVLVSSGRAKRERERKSVQRVTLQNLHTQSGASRPRPLCVCVCWRPSGHTRTYTCSHTSARALIVNFHRVGRAQKKFTNELVTTMSECE